MAEESRKREFRIDSSDSARPQVTLQDEPRYFSDIKPKNRKLVDIIYEDTGVVEKTRKGVPVKLILKTKIFDDGVYIQKTVGEENEDYQQFLRTGESLPTANSAPTARPKSAAVEAALKKAKAANKAAPKKAAADKE